MKTISTQNTSRASLAFDVPSLTARPTRVAHFAFRQFSSPGAKRRVYRQLFDRLAS